VPCKPLESSEALASASLRSPSAHLRVASFNSVGQSALTGSTFLEDPFKDVYDCLWLTMHGQPTT
jgi:hypothetical protein